MVERRKIPARLRKEVAKRAKYRCEYCQSPEHFSLDTFTIDHILPLSEAGGDDLENLAFACHNCNNRKQNTISIMDPETEVRIPLFNPRIDRWYDHFRWSDDTLTLEP